MQKSDISERDKKKIGDLIKPINTSRLEIWKQRLNPNEITLIEHFCAKTGQKFGYQPTLQISASTHLKLNLRYLFPDDIYTNIILPYSPNIIFTTF
ncbi:MAG: hypothetical protein IPN94_13620 [Sphingobacteriales bacterium]|nr:hypothetical protein [Sphingobacteriales bacterium]